MTEDNKYNILLVEDNPGEAKLALEILNEIEKCNSPHHATDGIQALDFLYKRNEFKNALRPDLIILDLNMPKKDGREVLVDIKNHNDLKSIPVIILTMSQSEDDINAAYNLHANCFLTKPLDFDEYNKMIHSIAEVWLSVISLPVAWYPT
jgi:two-component system, chemotaxis family, response regulator Rcp1